jgi:transcriptional regulator GlxA family with amidase domain
MKHVAILFLEGGFASTAILPLEIFSTAGMLWNGFNGDQPSQHFKVTSASVDGRPVKVDSRLSLTPECSFTKLGQPDLVFVPAGGFRSDELAHAGYDLEAITRANSEAMHWLRRWNGDGAEIASVCSGVALLAAAGLLDGKQATAHWGVMQLYREHFPNVQWQEKFAVIDNGDTYCSSGLNGPSDLSLYLVEKYCGRDIAVQCARALSIEMPKRWHATFTQLSRTVAHDDERIFAAQQWLQERYAEEQRFEEVARKFGMSGRNFARRFKNATGESPLAYLHGMRIAAAKQLLESTLVSVQEIAQKVGYSDVLFFRELFKRHTGVSPSEYRRRIIRPPAIETHMRPEPAGT